MLATKKILLLLLFLSNYTFGQNLSDAYRAKAESLYQNNEEALKYYKLAFNEALKAKDYVRCANLCIDISSQHHRATEFDIALKYCWQADSFFKKSSSKPDTILFKINSSLGTMYKNINRKDSAYHYFALADKVLSQNKTIAQIIPDYVQSHYNIQGRWLNSLGEFKSGTVLIEKAVEMARKHFLVEEEIIALTNLAATYQTLGIYDKALHYRLEASKIKTKDDLLKCQNLAGLGWVFVLNKKPDEGIAYLTKAMNLYESLRVKNKIKPNFDLYTTILNNIGTSLLEKKEYQKAEEYFNRVVAEYKINNRNRGLILSKSYMQLGILQKIKGRFSSSVKYLQLALISAHTQFSDENIAANPQAKGAINEKQLITVLLSKGNTLESLYQNTSKVSDLENISRTYLSGISIINELRGSFDTNESKLFLNEQNHNIYDLALNTLFRLYELTKKEAYKEAIFHVTESSKSSILSEFLRESVIKPQTIPYQLLNNEAKLKNDISKLKNLNSLDSSQQVKLRDLELEKYKLVRKFEQEYPNYYQLKYSKKPYKLADIQGRLAKDESFISYYLSSEFLYIIVINTEKFEIIKQPINTKEFNARIDKFKQIIYKNPGLNLYQGVELSAYLYKTLFLPVEKLLTNRSRLIICRDWQFSFLPFEILETGRYVYDYLAKKYSFRYAYLAELIVNQTQNNPNRAVLGVAPFTINKFYASDTLFKYLPDSEAQVRRNSNEVLVDSLATKERFLGIYKNFGVINFATHSIVNIDNSRESYIAFNPRADYKLRIDEIYNLDFSGTNLVVLSSCEADKGKIYKSEGAMSLARAFIYSGCRAVLTTLWATNDASSTYLAERFHYYLQEGEPKDLALQKARLDFFSSDFGKKYNHPFFWGNFNLIGNNDPVFHKAVSKWYFMALPLLLILFAGGYKYYKTKKEKHPSL